MSFGVDHLSLDLLIQWIPRKGIESAVYTICTTWHYIHYLSICGTHEQLILTLFEKHIVGSRKRNIIFVLTHCIIVYKWLILKVFLSN